MEVNKATEEQAQVPALELIDDTPETVKTDLRKFNKTEDQVNKAVAALSTVVDIKDKADLDTAMDIIKKAKKVVTIIDSKRKALGEPFREAVDKINAHAKKLTDRLPGAIRTAEEAVLAYNRKLEQERIQKRTEARIEQLRSVGFIPEYIQELGKEAQELSCVKNQEWDLTIAAKTLQTAEDAAWPGMLQKVTDLINEKIAERNKKLAEEAEKDAFFGEETTTAPIAAPVVAPVAVPKVAAAPAVKGVTKRWTFTVVDPNKVPREYLTVDETKIRAAMNAGVRDIPGVHFSQTESITSR